MNDLQKNLLGAGAHIYAAIICIPLLGIVFLFKNPLILNWSFAVAMLYLATYFLTLALALWRSDDFASFWFTKPMRGGSVADECDGDYVRGLWRIRRIYAPFYMVSGLGPSSFLFCLWEGH